MGEEGEKYIGQRDGCREGKEKGRVSKAEVEDRGGREGSMCCRKHWDSA